jgi:serine/threonine-protein kinase
LLASLRWRRAVVTVPPPAIAERLEQLASLAERDGRGLRWPWSTAGHSAARGWCNGSAGLVHLWTAAHTAFGDERWLRMAEGAAWHASAREGIIPQLCCGLAGQAYAHLELYRHSGERHWLTLARQLADAAAAGLDTPAGTMCVSGSLHKGDVGVAVLAADLERPEEASMPFFGPAG